MHGRTFGGGAHTHMHVAQVEILDYAIFACHFNHFEEMSRFVEPNLTKDIWFVTLSLFSDLFLTTAFGVFYPGVVIYPLRYQGWPLVFHYLINTVVHMT